MWVDKRNITRRRRLPWSAHEILEEFHIPLEILNDYIETKSLGQPVLEDSEVSDEVYDAISVAFKPTLNNQSNNNSGTKGVVLVEHALIALDINLRVLNEFLSKNKMATVKTDNQISLSKYKIISQEFQCRNIHLGFHVGSYVVSSLEENPLISDQIMSIGSKERRFIKSPLQRVPDYSYKIVGDGKPPIPPGLSEYQQKWFRQKTDYYDARLKELSKQLNQRVYKFEKYKYHEEVDGQYCTLFATSSFGLANNDYSLFYGLSKEAQKIQETKYEPHCYFILTKGENVIDYIDISDGLSSTNEIIYSCGNYKIRVSDQMFEVYSSEYFNYLEKDKRVDLDVTEINTLQLFRRQKRYADQLRYLEELRFDELYQFANKAYNHVESFDIDRILASLKVNIEERFIHRVSRDDYYYVDETRTVDYPVDPFIAELFRLGTHQIHRKSGYVPAEEMRIPGLMVGNIEGETLKTLRTELRQQYSKERHLKYLLSKEPKMKELLSNYSSLYNDSMASNLLSFTDYVDRIVTNRYWTSFDELIEFFQHQS